MIWLLASVLVISVNASPLSNNPSISIVDLENVPKTTNLSIIPLVANSECKTAGYSCMTNCTELVLCVDLGSSVFHASTVITCDKTLGQFCSLENLDCSGKYCVGEDAENEDFVCKAKGSFPHPYDCTQYYICTDEGKVINSTKCPDVNTSFNALTGKCDGKLDSRPCKESPVDTCNKTGQTGPIVENPILFYICEVNENGFLVPDLYACTNGFEYDKEEKSCKKKDSSGGGNGGGDGGDGGNGGDDGNGGDGGGGGSSMLIVNSFVVFVCYLILSHF